MHRFFLLAFVPLLAGCNAKESPLVRDVARAVLTAQAYEEALRSLRRDDNIALAHSIDKLTQAGRVQDVFDSERRLSFSEYFVDTASNAEIETRKLQSKEKRAIQIEAAKNYRRALALSSDFPSKNPRLLNSLGYFLADRGTSRDDFIIAEKLTRRAVALLPGKTPDANRAVIRDSLAWALFKLNRLEEAEREQREAVRESRATKSMSAEVALHLGEILAKAGKKDQARVALKEALTLPEGEADGHERAQKLLQSL